MKKIVLKLIRFYQGSKKSSLSQALHFSDSPCRFVPTCSQYSYQAIEKYGILSGSLLSIRRIFKCHPWGTSGSDPLK